MATFDKLAMERRAKEIEVRMTLKSDSRSLMRYFARFKATKELYGVDYPAAVEEMLKQLYKAGHGTPRGWAEQLEGHAQHDADAGEALMFLMNALGPAPTDTT
jgi:hypothetical protein